MWVLFWIVLLGSGAFAAPILLNETQLIPPLSSQATQTTTDPLDEHLPILDLQRFGIGVQTSSLDTSIRLEANQKRLEWQEGRGWVLESLVLQEIAPPMLQGSQILVPLHCLRALGFLVTPLESGVIAVRSNAELPTGGLNQLQNTNLQKGGSTKLELQFLREPEFVIEQYTGGRGVIRFKNTAASERFWAVGAQSLSRARVWQTGPDSMLELELPQNTQVAASTQDNRLLLELTDANAPPPIVPSVLPPGVLYQTVAAGILGKLHLIRLDPVRFRPEVRTAAWGGAKSILEFGAGAVAAVNGGYFDPPSMQPVDLLFNGGLFAYARGNRASVGFTAQGAIFGTPRARLALITDVGVANVNQIRPVPHPQNLTFFIGDGFVSVGGLGYTTLVLAQGKVLERWDTAFVPQLGQITVTFNPKTNPNLERKIGESADVRLLWGDPAWEQVHGAVAAGPRLLEKGAFAVNAKAEGFDQNGEIWRPTRQVGIGQDKNGFYVLAMLELGSPEDFARALLAQGLLDALRLDSGTSAQMYLAGGLVAGRLGRVVPNAIAFVPQ
ncbi:MAG: phosphodiester glycosidase family protein [Deinococcales bacterium]